MSWTPLTDADRRAMLETAGLGAPEDLFACIPDGLRLRSWPVPEGISEMRVREEMERYAARNMPGRISFLGGGYYDHYIPAAVDALTGRSEFYTAYTPYQPECAQGTLQSIYEYQSAICRLTNMEFANASLYEGGTAVFEAALMAMRVTGRDRIVCDRSVNPRWRQMLQTHTAHLDLDIREGTDPTKAACVIVQNPSFLGDISDYSDLRARCHEAGALLVISFYPIALGITKTPGEMGADIAVAEGQSLGIPLMFGGPYLGILATRKQHVRKMPGRLAGATVDAEGRRGFVLTLQAREQHIRRSKAMSNICSNQALCALRALIYLSLMGKEGFRELAVQCHSKAEYLKTRLDFVDILNESPTFNEFVVRLPEPATEVAAKLKPKGIIAGLPLAALGEGESGDLLVAVTEKHSREQLDTFAAALRDVLTREMACN